MEGTYDAHILRLASWSIMHVSTIADLYIKVSHRSDQMSLLKCSAP